jgi:hypothetical protein
MGKRASNGTAPLTTNGVFRMLGWLALIAGSGRAAKASTAPVL